MPELVTDCPRCRANEHTFDVGAVIATRVEYGWQHWYEAFSVCRNCHRSTVFILAEKTGHDIHMFRDASPMKVTASLNNYFQVNGFISYKDVGAIEPPDNVPEAIAKVFKEGAVSFAVQCWNAAGCMFRSCLDLATRPLLPKEETPGLNSRTRRDLGLRLPWLFDNGLLPADLRPLSDCVREDGNDGVHQGTLSKDDAADLLDFTVALLERICTEPARIAEAQKRREARRATSKKE